MPSPSVSAVRGFVLWMNSCTFVTPSLSLSSAASRRSLGERLCALSHSSGTPSRSASLLNVFSRGKGSSASLMPSPSVSGARGFVPSSTSFPSARPSPSVSAFSGFKPRTNSSLSVRESPSVSAFRGLVFRKSSRALMRPSPSGSAVRSSLASRGLRPARISAPSASPPPSVSARNGCVSPVSTISLALRSSSASARPSPSVSPASICPLTERGNRVQQRMRSHCIHDIAVSIRCGFSARGARPSPSSLFSPATAPCGGRGLYDRRRGEQWHWDPAGVSS